ncbi:hypothetical protein [Streptomyces sp. V2I9]|uniref:hypothetical protein n=1 Tax=Streptomyces sp. V2I9 TaxID=3042304 RepID=UPI00277E020F|nr:hypothetical protein [Streptomyces sp. V2I9]MDQ0983746.1 hypothetical protein [Streptomyces sp. V2I9]
MDRSICNWSSCPTRTCVCSHLWTGCATCPRANALRPAASPPLAGLPALTSLRLHGTDEPYDLAPPAGMEGLTVHVAYGTHVTGTRLFPPERVVRLP